jgi:hypothetical protein
VGKRPRKLSLRYLSLRRLLKQSRATIYSEIYGRAASSKGVNACLSSASRPLYLRRGPNLYVISGTTLKELAINRLRRYNIVIADTRLAVSTYRIPAR